MYRTARTRAALAFALDWAQRVCPRHAADHSRRGASGTEVNPLTNTKPWMISPMDATPRNRPADDNRSRYAESWPRAVEWRKRLIAQAGPPGRCNRHGEPLGPAKRADQS
jgi:hypothetical protein